MTQDIPFSVIDIDALPERFRKHIEIGDDGCWLWTGRLSRNGYARVYLLGKEVNAARAIWDLFVAPIGRSKKELDHRCPNRPRRSCVRPDHLALVTAKVNTLSSRNPCAINSRKTKCKRGHDLKGDNLRWSTRSNGHRFRVCKQCSKFWRKQKR